MELSIFEVLGPIMVGPSSSHTAGAVRLGSVAAKLAPKPFDRVRFALGGSFAKTGLGHGTDRALLAGVMGFSPDDESISQSQSIADERGLTADFCTEELEGMHENSVHITLYHSDDTQTDVWGSSLGGGRIRITRLNDFETMMQAESPTLLIKHFDKPGVISDISSVLALNNINIALLRLSRQAKGESATTMVIVDSEIPPRVAERIRGLRNVERVVVLDVQ